MNPVVSERLKEALRWWKSLSYHYEMLVRCDVVLNGYMVNENGLSQLSKWRGFERFVMDNSNVSVHSSDWSLETDPITDPHLHALKTFPAEFFQWSRISRHVYKLDSKLQSSIATWDFSSLRWDEVVWPFKSFVIQLSEPFLIEDRPNVWSRYDTILVTQLPLDSNDVVLRTFRLFRAPYAENAGEFLERDRRLVDDLFRQNRIAECRRALRVGFKRMFKRSQHSPQAQRYVGWSSINHPAGSNILIEPNQLRDSLRLPNPTLEWLGLDEDETEYADWELANSSAILKLVIGLCVHIASVSAPSRPWQPQERHVPGDKGTTGIITDPEFICETLLHGTIDPATYGLREVGNANSGYFKRPHPRRAHMRRPWGSPPNAPRTVFVPETIVRKDLIPRFGLLSGTTTTVLPHDWDDD